MGNITVMLVDDEQMVLDDLIHIINWESMGFSIVATAKNGKQALKKYRESSPQIIFTDIKMPLIDGVELAKELRRIGENPIIIFLTAYQDFNYAKQAFLYGIDDYLLKNEIDEQHLREKLEKLRDRVERESRVTGLLNRKFVVSVLKQREEPVPGSAAERTLLSQKLMHCFIEEDEPCPPFDYKKEDRSRQITECIEAVFQAEFRSFPVHILTEIEHGRGLMSIGYSPDQPLESIVRGFTLRLKRIQAALKADFGRSFSAILIPKPVALLALREFYAQIDSRFHAKYFNGCGSVYAYNAPELFCSSEQHRFDFDRIYTAVNMRDEGKVIQFIGEIYAKIIENRRYEELIAASHTLYQILNNLISEKKPTRPIDIQSEKNRACWYHAEDIKNWMLDQYSQVFRLSGMADKKAVSQPIKRAISLIEERYGSSDLKIDAIAEYAGLSASRLSVLFKTEMGETVNEYLTDFRMMRAQYLLREGTYKIYEVAEQVGYGSSQYFSQVFYQRVGVTPKNFGQKVMRHE